MFSSQKPRSTKTGRSYHSLSNLSIISLLLFLKFSWKAKDLPWFLADYKQQSEKHHWTLWHIVYMGQDVPSLSPISLFVLSLALFSFEMKSIYMLVSRGLSHF